MRRLAFLLLLLCCLLLTGCGEATAPLPEEEAAQDSSPTPTPLPLPTPTPELRFANGKVYHGYEISIDLSGITGADVKETIELLRQMPNVHNVDLGTKPERGGLSFYRIRQLQEAFPEVDFLCRFTLWGQEVTTLDTALDLKHIKMDDEGDRVLHALRCMPRCRSLDMDSCGVSSEAMQRIREEFPGVEVNWRIWFGREFSVRTDVERIIAPNYLNDENSRDLRYCTKVRLLDIGHNPDLSDIGFLAEMPELEVCILAIMPFRDLSPLAGCSKLEYLELCEVIPHPGRVLDLAPLAGLTQLRHLNICKLYEVENYEFLESFTQLERLWIGAYTYIPEEFIERLKLALPETKINWWTKVCVTEKWREDPPGIWVERYALLREQFDYRHFDRVAAYWWNDPLCEGNAPGKEK